MCERDRKWALSFLNQDGFKHENLDLLALLNTSKAKKHRRSGVGELGA